jgi:hypothetical protein
MRWCFTLELWDSGTLEPHSSVYPCASQPYDITNLQWLVILIQVAEHIREILRLMIDVRVRILRELNERVDQTSKFDP